MRAAIGAAYASAEAMSAKRHGARSTIFFYKKNFIKPLAIVGATVYYTYMDAVAPTKPKTR